MTRSISQLRRKFATDGTKMSTSASMTKAMVSRSSFAGRLVAMLHTPHKGCLAPPVALRA